MPGGALMTPTRLRTLFLIAAVLAAVSWLLLRAVYGSLPSFPWTMVPALIIAAGGEAPRLGPPRPKAGAAAAGRPHGGAGQGEFTGRGGDRRRRGRFRRGRGGLAAGPGGRPRRAHRQRHLRRGGGAGRGRAVPGALLPRSGRSGFRAL